MGRKKKIVVEEQPKVEETKTSTSNSLLYQGQVKLSITNGKKVISTKTFHNTGKKNLFEFICKCLAGNFVDSARPQRIALFKNGEAGIESEDDKLFTKDNMCTPAILNDTTAIINLTADNTGQQYYTVTYHFRIPYSYINGNTLHAAALFSSTYDQTAPYNSLFATYKFLNEAKSDWAPIEIDSSLAGNWSIIIEWTMSIKNYEGGN